MCHMDKETKVCLIRVVVFIVYLHIGALVFMITEGKAPSERNAKEIMRTLQKKIIKKYNMTESEFKHLVEEIKAGCSGEPLEWTFLLSTSFTFQLLTTIGYGNITPKTYAGRLLTILYALVAIPLTIITMKSVGHVYNTLLKRILTGVEVKCLKRALVQRLELKLLVLNLLAVSVLIFSGALISIHDDGWSFVQGLYVWFITFTTVGFGEAVPRIMTEYQLNFLTVAGLCFMSALVDSIALYVEKANPQVIRCRGQFLGCCCSCSTRSVEMEGETGNSEIQESGIANNVEFISMERSDH